MIRKYIFYLSITLLSIFLFVKPSLTLEWFYVKWVHDGDTISLTDGRHIRYIGINAPEIDHDNKKAEPFGYQAKKYNEKLVLSKRIRLDLDKEDYDRYGRLLAYVFLTDGTFVNNALIKNGYAYVLPRGSSATLGPP